MTLADLASFRPAAPSLASEPGGGVGIVGMPTNLVAEAGEQSIAGTVLGRPVTVRFTPTAFVFDHGDGTLHTSATGGSTWSGLGQPEFTPTPTSHVYAVRGSYSVTATVRYSAAVDFGNGRWRPVAGVVETMSEASPLRIVEVRSALVDATCEENPRGPGCG